MQKEKKNSRRGQAKFSANFAFLEFVMREFYILLNVHTNYTAFTLCKTPKICHLYTHINYSEKKESNTQVSNLFI